MLQQLPYDPSSAKSIFEHASLLIDKSLRMLYNEEAEAHERKGKGGLGQMVEELHYRYTPNSVSDADFAEAKVELKCTPLKRTSKGLAIKERLVCNMIDYEEVDKQQTLADSHFWQKCKTMLFIFYLHQAHSMLCDLIFLYRILWSFPEKDRLIIEKDYSIIYNKIHKGLAHTLSEGDTMYLGACRKGQKGDSLRAQPNSSIGAKRRAFSLKPAYMRTILAQVEKSPDKSLCMYDFGKPKLATGEELRQQPFENIVHAQAEKNPDQKLFTKDLGKPELVSVEELRTQSFEDIVLARFSPFYGKNYIEIADALKLKHSNAKHKYSIIANGIASKCDIKSIDESEEFQKSGIRLKTVRLEYSGTQKESMAFKNIDYFEIMNCAVWEDSDLYEIFTSRFMFVVFKQVDKKATININGKTEKEYVLDKVFFWTMPQEDVEKAEKYWEHIREQVIANRISLDYFWKIKDDKNYHVRPKSKKKIVMTENPHGGLAEKYCYWFNAKYVQSIINSIERKK